MSNARRICVCFYLMQVMGQFLPRLCFHSERTFSRIPCFVTNDSAFSVPPPLGAHINAEKALDCSDQRFGLPSGFFHVETGSRLVPLLKLCFRHSLNALSVTQRWQGSCVHEVELNVVASWIVLNSPKPFTFSGLKLIFRNASVR